MNQPIPNYTNASVSSGHTIELAADSYITLPVVQEFVDVKICKNITGIVRLEKAVHHIETVVEENLLAELISVEHVPVNRYLDAPVATRQEGDVTIIPVMEEIVIVRKQLVLKEEVRITRQPRHSVHREDVSLRSETIRVERLPVSLESNLS